MSLLACQLPLVWNRSYRGWRLLFRETQSHALEAELLKFGLSDLLGATAGAAIAFATWRLQISEMSKGSYGSEETLAASLVYIVLSLIAGSLLLPLVSFVFGDRPRQASLALAAVYLGGIVMALTVTLLWLSSNTRSFETRVAAFAYLSAIASAALAVFWIGRELGYRLLRARTRGLFDRWTVPRGAWRAIAEGKQLRPGLLDRWRVPLWASRAIAKTKQLDRAFFEWGSIACATIAAACMLFWLVSLSTTKADLGFAFGLENEITVARGTVTISVIVSSHSVRQAWFTPSKPRTWKVPGLEVERLEDYGGRTWLTVKCSLLIPGLTAAALAAFFARRRSLIHVAARARSRLPA